MKKTMILLVIIIICIAGCAQKQQKPEVNIIIEEPKENITEPQQNQTQQQEQTEEDMTTIYITATETEFIPSEIRLKYNEKAKLTITSNYTHNFYAPTLNINKEIQPGKTIIYVPTDRKGSNNFWCNMLHYGSQHSRMKGRIYIE